MNVWTLPVVIFTLLITQYSFAGSKMISCQIGYTSADAFQIVEIDDDHVRFIAQDDNVGITDFVGELTKFSIGEVIEVEARTKGWDAWQFLDLKIDTSTGIVTIQQRELATTTIQYLCRAIHLML